MIKEIKDIIAPRGLSIDTKMTLVVYSKDNFKSPRHKYIVKVLKVLAKNGVRVIFECPDGGRNENPFPKIPDFVTSGAGFSSRALFQGRVIYVVLDHYFHFLCTKTEANLVIYTPFKENRGNYHLSAKENADFVLPISLLKGIDKTVRDTAQYLVNIIKLTPNRKPPRR